MEGQPEIVPVLEAHRLDEARLAAYLKEHNLLDGALKVRQFQGGQSNPTYFVTWGLRRLVLRRKPAGAILPGAHAIEREFRVLRALEDTNVPVPRALMLEEDAEVSSDALKNSERIKGDLDGLLDEIDEVLEANAEDFVKSYIQKGGE